MNLKSAFLLVLVACTITAGCQLDSDAETPVREAQAQEHTQAADDEPRMESVTGQLSGFDCAVVGELCPSTHRGGDYTTGVFTEDESFYFVVNIPNSFLTQYFLETVEIEGTVYGPYDHAVEPETIHLLADGERRRVYDAGYFIDEDGQRATFHEGQYRDGQWIVP